MGSPLRHRTALGKHAPMPKETGEQEARSQDPATDWEVMCAPMYVCMYVYVGVYMRRTSAGCSNCDAALDAVLEHA